LYYASGHDVYCLFTSTKKRRHIATLPFEARCTASGYGWVCVGGEDEGHFAAIKLDGGPRSNEVDERLDIGGAWASGSSLGGSSTARRGATVKVERIGEEIVNSISIHRIQDEEAHLDDIVAVLTNNDKTVRVYSLPQRLETCVLDLPFAMNHATISPDGTMLVAVGDVNQAYFFRRYIKDDPPQIPKPHNRLTSGSVDWKLTSVVNLHVGAPDSTLGYFTTAWSPNGRLIALGSEGGYITVLDLDILDNCELEDEEAIVAVVPGSRPDIPQPHPGAVRSMLFAPDSWDLLIWAEDQGRVCIGDLRTGLKRKQVVTLDPREEGLPKIEFEDLPLDELETSTESVARTLDQLERDFLRRYRDAQARDSTTAVNFATEYIEARRRQRQHRQDLATSRATSGSRAALDDDPRGLTTQEQEILDALRTTRHREEARTHNGVATNVNYTSGDIFGTGARSSSSGTPNPESGTTRSGGDASMSWSDTFPELLRMTASPRQDPPGDAASWASRHNQSSSEARSSADTTTSGSSSTTHTNHNPRLPRRRASVILSPPTTTASGSASASTSSSRPTASSNREAEASNNAWRTIENALSLTRGPLFESASRATGASGTTATASTSTATTAELAAERARARTLTNQRDRWRALASDGTQPPSAYATGANATATISRLAATAAFPDGYEAVLRRMRVGGIAGPSMGVRTAGLAMSGDGSTVWAACEEGIFELKIERKKRMFWPAVEMR
jgi:hypothetical protein